nr:RecName: Full=Potassium channel toxin alpha-KTx 32.1 [Centruroides margaritatus]
KCRECGNTSPSCYFSGNCVNGKCVCPA